MNDVLLQEAQKPVAGKDIADEINLSRDIFLASFRSFQSDLYREKLTPQKVKAALREIRTQGGLLENVSVSQFLVTTIRYRKEGDIERALNLFYQSANRLKRPILYVLKKESGFVTLRLGVVSPNAAAADEMAVFNEYAVSMPNVFSGFLPGSECAATAVDELSNPANPGSYTHRRVIVGVPGKRRDGNDKSKQADREESSSEGFGIERVVDSVEEDFMVAGISVPVENSVINEGRAIFSAAHDYFHVLSKHTEQMSEAIAQGKSIALADGKTITIHEPSTSVSEHYGDAIGTSFAKIVIFFV